MSRSAIDGSALAANPIGRTSKMVETNAPSLRATTSPATARSNRISPTETSVVAAGRCGLSMRRQAALIRRRAGRPT
jgi:hypothetical protein